MLTQEWADLVGLVVAIAAGFLLAVAFYQSLCKRDVLVERVRGLASRATARPWLRRLVYWLAVLVGLPMLIVLWVFVLELLFLLVSSVDRVSSAGLIALGIVGAARLLAYIHAPSSHELAKAIPLSLAVVLITGGQFNLDRKLAVLDTDARGLVDPIDHLLPLLVGLEIALRLATDGSNGLLAWLRERQGIESDRGALSTLRVVVMRRLRGPRPVADDDLPEGDVAA